MNAVILADGESSKKMHALTQACPAPLIPLVNRPFIQHVVEYLVGRGFHELDVILYNQPEMIESLLEDGTRWGCSIRFHLLRDTAIVGKAIKLIHQRSRQDLVLLAEAVTLPQTDLLQSMPESKAHSPVLFCTENGHDCSPADWTGWAWLHTENLRHIPDQCDKNGLGASLLEQAGGNSSIIPVDNCMDINTYHGILKAHRTMLDKNFKGLLFTGKEVEEGIWLSRNVILHPTARITPPVYIGRNCRIGRGVQLGPYASVGRNCVLDKYSSVVDSVVFPDTYAGESLDLKDVIVDRNRLINTRFDSEVLITDPFILSSLKDRQVRKWLSGVFSRIFACILLMIALPFFPAISWYAGAFRSGRLVTRTRTLKLPAPHDRAMWNTYDLLSFPSLENHLGNTDTKTVNENPGKAVLNHFLLKFLPGLINVAKGDLQIIGVATRSPDEVHMLDDEWKEAYLRSKAGLITEAIINFGLNPSSHELYSAEMLYSKTFSRLGDLILIWKYFKMVFHALFSRT